MNSPIVSESLQRVYRNLHGRLIAPHQPDGVRWMLSREYFDTVKGGIVADEMGLGKTVSALSVIIGNPQNAPTLIVAPKSLVKQWAKECEKFLAITPLVVSTLDAGRIAARDVLQQRVIITSYHALLSKKGLNALMTTTYGRIILDEAHAIKNKHTKFHHACCALNAGIRWCLTGTPVTRVKGDFLSLIAFLGVSDNREYGTLRQRFLMRRTFEDLCGQCERLRLPPLCIREHKIPFGSEDEVALYDDMKMEGSLRLAAYETGIASADNTMAHIIEVILRLRQLVVNPKLVHDWHGNATKLNALVDLISQQTTGSKTLVFTHWNMELDDICRVLSERLHMGVVSFNGSMNAQEREDAVNAFNMDSRVDVMVLNIDAGGVGLNLQAATHVYLASLDWSAACELQAISRAHRIGVTHEVHVTRLVIEGTIDEYMMQKQQLKLDMAAEVLDDTRIRGKLGGNPLSLREMRAIFE